MPCPYTLFWPQYVTKLSAELQRDLDINLLPNGKIIYVQVDTCKDRIAAALETLRPTSSWERGAASGQEEDTVLLGGRGFGTAMSALIEYLSSEYGSTFALGRSTHFPDLMKIWCQSGNNLHNL